MVRERPDGLWGGSGPFGEDIYYNHAKGPNIEHYMCVLYDFVTELTLLRL